jgi:hypothetical protein
VLPVIDAALAAGRTSLQVLFDGLAARGQVAPELLLSSIEQQALQDWDRPSDMDGSVPDREP